MVKFVVPRFSGGCAITARMRLLQTKTKSQDMAQRELATLAGGCFWCLEAVFEQLQGVQKVESGYTGGATTNPTYKAVCGGDTGHAEVVQVTFDPAAISFSEILDVFFATHDPTTLNRQGACSAQRTPSTCVVVSSELILPCVRTNAATMTA